MIYRINKNRSWVATSDVVGLCVFFLGLYFFCEQLWVNSFAQAGTTYFPDEPDTLFKICLLMVSGLICLMLGRAVELLIDIQERG